MARNVGVSIENSFVAGRVTEATGLNFPENAVVDEKNCVFDNKGKVSRRLGFDLEDQHAFSTVTRAGGAITPYIWKQANGQEELEFAVVQVEEILHFYRVTTSKALSDSKEAFTIDLDSFDIVGNPGISDHPCQFFQGNGRLFVVHPYCNPFFVTFNPDSDTITTTVLTIEIRDFTGVEDSLDLTTRPSTLTSAHHYNLLNQGWYATITNKDDTVDTAITIWNTDRTLTDYPSNADVWWIYKDTSEEFDVDLVDKFALPSTPAAKGHYILPAFNQDRATASGVAGVASTSSGYFRPSTGTFFSGRAFYSGVNARDYSNKIYFSQILEDMEQAGRCYQQNDPTSETLFDLLASDGGVIVVQDAGVILRLVALETALLVFASNGVWIITGSEGVGFKANDYTVRVIARMDIPSSIPFVDAGGRPIWWADGGIYTITQADQLGNIALESITDPTFKTFYEENIPFYSRWYAQGAYNPYTKTVQWLYRSNNPTTDLEKYEYDSVLVFNVLTRAFYTWTVEDASATLNGIFATRGLGPVEREVGVVDNLGNPVVDSNGEQVTATTTALEPLSGAFFYITTIHDDATDYDMSFSQTWDDRYVDWFKLDGTGKNFLSYCTSGYKIRGDAQRKFQANYLYTFLDDLPDASCYVAAVWDYGDRTSSTQQVYNNRPNRTVNFSRRKLRGSGITLQLKFFSEDQKPFRLIGWSVFETGNASV